MKRIVVLLLLCTLIQTSLPQVQQKAPPPMRQQAQTALQQAVKVDVIPGAQGKHAGEDFQVQVLLRDGKGEPVGALENTSIEIEVLQPSGKVSKVLVQLA